jgi:hypothetical protein
MLPPWGLSDDSLTEWSLKADVDVTFCPACQSVEPLVSFVLWCCCCLLLLLLFVVAVAVAVALGAAAAAAAAAAALLCLPYQTLLRSPMSLPRVSLCLCGSRWVSNSIHYLSTACSAGGRR